MFEISGLFTARNRPAEKEKKTKSRRCAGKKRESATLRRESQNIGKVPTLNVNIGRPLRANFAEMTLGVYPHPRPISYGKSE